MAKMTPARSSVGPTVPPEATKQGALNETLPLSKRNPGVPEELGEGPRVNPEGGYEPAAYKTVRGSVRVDR